MSHDLLIEYKDNTLCLTLNRPQRKNALSYTLLEELAGALNEASEDCHAVIISGNRDCFSAGADLNDVTGTIEDIEIDVAISKVIDNIIKLPVPVIAFVEAACVGGAVDIALACDFRVGNHNAWFQIPATRLGLLYNPDAVARMTKLFPQHTLTRLLALGERFDANEAKKAGLLTYLIDEEKEGMKMAQGHQTRPNNEKAVTTTKALLNDLYNDRYDPSYWQKVRKDILTSPERLEAITMAKNKPKNK